MTTTQSSGESDVEEGEVLRRVGSGTRRGGVSDGPKRKNVVVGANRRLGL